MNRPCVPNWFVRREKITSFVVCGLTNKSGYTSVKLLTPNEIPKFLIGLNVKEMSNKVLAANVWYLKPVLGSAVANVAKGSVTSPKRETRNKMPNFLYS